MWLQRVDSGEKIGNYKEAEIGLAYEKFPDTSPKVERPALGGSNEFTLSESF